MKRIYMLFLMIPIICFSGGCTHTNTLKTINIVTACGVVSGEEVNDYLFCVSDIASSEKENGGKQTFSLYKYSTSDFGEAVKELKKTIGFADFGHFEILISDIGYTNLGLRKDVEYMSTQIKINPMMKYFACSGNVEETLNSINSQYGQGADDFLAKVYNGADKKVLCTFAEILFSSENYVFTASVPVIDTDENGLVSEKGILLCASDGGVEFVTADDYYIFRNFLKKYGKNSGKLDIEISGDLLKVSFKTLETSGETGLIAELAQKYKNMNFDIFNAIYFSKKHFPTYSSYMDFIEYFPIYKLDYE